MFPEIIFKVFFGFQTLENQPSTSGLKASQNPAPANNPCCFCGCKDKNFYFKLPKLFFRNFSALFLTGKSKLTDFASLVNNPDCFQSKLPFFIM